MPLKWVDELDGTQPLTELEPFYILAALELGDPDGTPRWLEQNASEFHRMYKQYRRDITECGRSKITLPTDGAEVLIQYLVWYDRDSRRLKEGNPR